ncbi:MAG: FAD-binding oxidoreductase [Thermoplasmata archaeon]|nr:MAG: FAD-binding oxidoreductase [Thermoplasmata archaeon]
MEKPSSAVRDVLIRLARTMGENRVRRISKAPESILVRPKTNDDVITIMKLAVKHNVPIIPRRRWIALAETMVKSQIIMDLSDMNGIFKIDEENLAVTCGPGVLWKDLNETLSKGGLSLGVYPVVAAPSVGDWIDEGGTGIGSYTHGFAADQVRTLEVVLPDGKLINTGFKNVLSNSSGYNLNGLFVGADSTLGVVTKVTLKLYPAPEETRPIFYTFSDITGMTKALHDLTRIKATPLNISFYDHYHLKSLQLFGRDVTSLPGASLLNITLSGLTSIVEHDEGVIDEVMGRQEAKKEESERAQVLWDERFFYVEPKPAGLIPVFGEALVPASKLNDMINEAHTLIKKMGLKGAVTGTLCDRSTVSFSPYFLIRESQFRKSRLPTVFNQQIGEMALKHDGRPMGSSMMLGLNPRQIFGEGINTILDIKTALDPHNIMNPRDFA